MRPLEEIEKAISEAIEQRDSGKKVPFVRLRLAVLYNARALERIAEKERTA